MNCSDITEILDNREVGLLTTAEQTHVQAHLSTCRECSRDWKVHIAFASLPDAPDDPGLAARCRVLVAAGMPRGISNGRRLVLLGSFMTLAAAAAVTAFLHGRMENSTAALSPISAALSSRIVDASPEIKNEAPLAATSAPAAVLPKPITRAKFAGKDPLPLLLFIADNEFRDMIELAIQRAVERYPELLADSGSDEPVEVAMGLRADGSIFAADLRQVNGLSMNDLDVDVKRLLPNDTTIAHTSRKKGTVLPDGKVLHTNLMLIATQLPTGYDETHSSLRVKRSVLDRHADLLTLSTESRFNRIIIFLTEDGRIDRESIEPDSEVTRLDIRDPMLTDRFADQFATKLGLDRSRIGEMGTVSVEDSLRRQAVDTADIAPELRTARKLLFVHYAWPRRTGEAAPFMPFIARALAPSKPRFDAKSAAKLVEHFLPDAFIVHDKDAGSPTLVLSAGGEVIRAGWVKSVVGEDVNTSVRNQLVSGFQGGSFTSGRVTNSRGDSANVNFHWERPATAVPAVAPK